MITVTDSRGASASLPAFTITVPAAPPPTGTAALSWTPPTQYTDGSPLPPAELAGYRIYKGNSPSTLTRYAEVDGMATSYTVQDLASGTHYFAISAVAVGGEESALSGVGSKTIP